LEVHQEDSRNKKKRVKREKGKRVKKEFSEFKNQGEENVVKRGNR